MVLAGQESHSRSKSLWCFVSGDTYPFWIRQLISGLIAWGTGGGVSLGPPNSSSCNTPPSLVQNHRLGKTLVWKETNKLSVLGDHRALIFVTPHLSAPAFSFNFLSLLFSDTFKSKTLTPTISPHGEADIFPFCFVCVCVVFFQLLAFVTHAQKKEKLEVKRWTGSVVEKEWTELARRGWDFSRFFLKYLVAVPEKDTLPQISELMNDFYVRRIGGLIILMRWFWEKYPSLVGLFGLFFLFFLSLFVLFCRARLFAVVSSRKLW